MRSASLSESWLTCRLAQTNACTHPKGEAAKLTRAEAVGAFGLATGVGARRLSRRRAWLISNHRRRRRCQRVALAQF